MECQQKRPSSDMKLRGMLTNKAVGNNKALVVVDHTVGFAPAKQDDLKQEWTKKYDNEVNERSLAFVLVNDITRKAIKQPVAVGMPVSVVDYAEPVPGTHEDPSLLWIETDIGADFTKIREHSNYNLVLDARNDNLVVVSNNNGGDNQLWNFKEGKLDA